MVFTRQDVLVRVGNTDLGASQIREIAEDALEKGEIDSNPIAASAELRIFWSSAPNSGGTAEEVTVFFDEFDETNRDLLFGRSAKGEALVFMMNDPAHPATVLVYQKHTPFRE